MISKFKDLTENIQPLSSAGNTEALEPQSKPSASSDNTPPSTLTTKNLSGSMLSGENSALTTAATTVTTPTTVKITEKTRQHAIIAKVALLQLQKAGLLKRFAVLSEDETTVREIRLVLDPSFWTIDLNLIVLSDTDNTKADE